MARINDELINDIRHHADIGEVIGKYITVTKKGRNFVAVCPFHDDHDPSLSISIDKQIYKCFVCNAGGNVFTFVQEYEKVGFIEAVGKVAEHVGMHIDLPTAPIKPVDSRKEGLFKVMNEAISFMKFQLTTQSGKPYLEYLESRGLSKEIISMFDVGYNGPKDELLKFLKAKDYKESAMIATNIARLSESGLHDVFSNRITFPIHDTLGNPIAFSARSLEKDQPKYINSNETELYIKGNVLYNYHRAKQYVKKEGKLIVTEGVMDVIAYAKVGIYNVVATLGTACTKEQLRQMKQLSNNICIGYDGDKAGRNATYRLIQLANEQNINVSVIDNQTDLDPDDIIEKYGKEELIKMSNRLQTPLEYIFKYLQSQYNLDNYSEKKEFATKVKVEIDKSKDDFDKQNFYHQLSLITGFKMTQISEGKNEQKPVRTRKPQKVEITSNGVTRAEHQIIAQLLSSITANEIFKAELGYLINDVSKKCAMIISNEYRKYEKIEIAKIIDEASDELIKNLIIDCCNDMTLVQEFNEEVLTGSIRRIKRAVLESQIANLQQELKKVSDSNKQAEQLKELQAKKLELRGYIDEEC